MSMKKLIGYCITKSYDLYLKLFEQSSLAGTIMTLWNNILVSIKPKTSSTKSTIGQVFKKILRSISKTIIYAWV